MLIATQNVRGTPNMTTRDTNHDVNLTIGQAGVIAWQEMQHPNHQAALANLPAPWKTYVALKENGTVSGQAISWNSDLYDVVEREPGVIGHSHLLTSVVPFCSDERRVAVVILREKATGIEFVAACTHFPPKNKQNMLAHAEYAEGVKRLQRLIVAWYAHDLPFVLLGDFNRKSITRPLGQSAAGHHLYYRGSPLSIDLVITGNSSKYVWSSRGVRTLGGRVSDHKCRRLNATLKPAPEPAPPRKPGRILPPVVPFIAARWKGGRQRPGAVVMHGTVGPDRPGMAEAVARFFAREDNKTSAHYIVDPTKTIQCVGDHTIAFHCGYNTGSIGVELCDEETGPASRWCDANSEAILHNAAKLVAQLCLAYDIEIRRPSIPELRAKGPHGIYSHNDSRRAFGRTTHSDPIDFPWPQFMSLVHDAADALRAGR